MPKRRRLTGSQLLGQELRRLRGRRSLEEIARLSRTPPHADRAEPIAYSTLSMLERGVTMPSAQSLLTLSVLYRVPVQQLADLIALERYHARKPAARTDPAALERETVADLKAGRHGDAFAKALRCQELAAADSARDGDPEARSREAGASILAGIALWRLGWLSQAAAAFRDVLDDLDLRDDLRGWACQNLVEVERIQGRLATARAHARDGLDLAERAGSARLRGTFHGTLANLERDLGERLPEGPRRAAQCEAALRHHAQAQALARESADAMLLAHDVVNEGVTHAVAGRPELARERLEDGLRRAEAAGLPRLHAFGLLELGKLDVGDGQLLEARRTLRRSQAEAVALEANDLVFLSCFHQLKVALLRGEEVGEAWSHCHDLSSLLDERLPEIDELEQLRVAQGGIMMRRGLFAGALALLLTASSPRGEVSIVDDQVFVQARPGEVWTRLRTDVPSEQLLNPFGDARGDGRPSTARNPVTGAWEVAWGRAGREPAVMFASWDAVGRRWDVRRIAPALGASRWAGRVVRLLHDEQGNRFVVFEDPDSARILLASAPRDSAHVNRPIELTTASRPGTSPDAAWDGRALVVAYVRSDVAGAVEISEMIPDWDAEGRIPNGGEGIPGIPEPIFSYSGRPGAIFARPLDLDSGPRLDAPRTPSRPDAPPLLRLDRFADGRMLVTWIDGARLSFTVREAGTWSPADSIELPDPVEHELARVRVREMLHGRLTPLGQPGSGRRTPGRPTRR